jgi:chloramphenicol O-acetyltransferase
LVINQIPNRSATQIAVPKQGQVGYRQSPQNTEITRTPEYPKIFFNHFNNQSGNTKKYYQPYEIWN